MSVQGGGLPLASVGVSLVSKVNLTGVMQWREAAGLRRTALPADTLTCRRALLEIDTVHKFGGCGMFRPCCLETAGGV
jgi:hypothetical protein